MQVGPYRVVSELARGGAGVVYRAEGPNGEDVALKLLLPEHAASARARTRFEREAAVISRLRHPNVVSLLGSGVHEGMPWLALDFVDGPSLQTRLREGPLPIATAISVTRQLATALAYVHTHGLAHRDLKPDNVLLQGDRVLLTDFGLVLDEDSSATRLTRTGVFLGTPGYWAPEQAKGDKARLGPQTDLYGLGAVLYACLTGSPPVQAASLMAFIATVEFQKVSPPHVQRPEVPKWLSTLCMRCLALDPAGRPGSATEVARCLDRSTADLQSRARGLAPIALALGVVTVLVLTLALVVVWDSNADPTPPTESSEPSGPSDPTAPTAATPPQPDLPLRLAIEGWPTGDVAEAICLFEPWAITRHDAGLRLRSQGPAIPEVAIPLRYGGGPWDVRVRLATLELSGPSWVAVTFGTLPPSTLRGAPPADEQPPPKALGLLLSLTADYQLALRPIHDPQVSGTRHFPLDTDPRGPLTLCVSWREPQLTLAVYGPTGELLRQQQELSPDALPSQSAVLRIGSQLPQLRPSRGNVYDPWHEGHGEVTIAEVKAWGPRLRLDLDSSERTWVEGRVGWGFLNGTPEPELRETLEELGRTTLLQTSDRWSLYLLALLAARDGNHTAAAQQIGALHAYTSGFEKPASRWNNNTHWIRNRVQIDLAHYPQPLRAALVESLPFLRPLEEARRASISRPAKPSDWFNTQHARAWAHAELALHVAAGADPAAVGLLPARNLAFAGLLEEAWLALEADPRPPQTPDDTIWKGWIAFNTGRYREALKAWGTLPESELPPNLAPPRKLAQAWTRPK